jgi:hypothetical protein
MLGIHDLKVGNSQILRSVNRLSWFNDKFYTLKYFTVNGRSTENTAAGILHVDHVEPSIRKVGTNFADKRQSLGRHSSLVNSDRVVCFVLLNRRS